MKHEFQCSMYENMRKRCTSWEAATFISFKCFRPRLNTWNKCFICLLKLMGKLESNFFVYDCGTHYSNCCIKLLFTLKLIVFEVRTGILCDNIFDRSS